MPKRVKREEWGEIVLPDGNHISNEILDFIASKGLKNIVLSHLNNHKTHYLIVKETELDEDRESTT